MRQQWKNLLFLHWRWDAQEIQRTLPPELTAETFDGTAWLGIVPFFMRGVRPVCCPPVPWISNFLELNVRTYVRDANGHPGVWFYSLDCNQPLAVKIAQTAFHLPYFHARMRARVAEGMIDFNSVRRGRQAGFVYAAEGSSSASDAGSLEEFLLERYRLFSRSRTSLFSGQVWHTPYTFSPARVAGYSTAPLELAGFAPPAVRPDHAVFSRGVDVRIYPLLRLKSRVSSPAH